MDNNGARERPSHVDGCRLALTRSYLSTGPTQPSPPGPRLLSPAPGPSHAEVFDGASEYDPTASNRSVTDEKQAPSRTGLFRTPCAMVWRRCSSRRGGDGEGAGGEGRGVIITFSFSFFFFCPPAGGKKSTTHDRSLSGHTGGGKGRAGGGGVLFYCLPLWPLTVLPFRDRAGAGVLIS